MRTPEELLGAYVEAHNVGVRTGDFGALDALLQPTASMRFHGIEVGPFDSSVAILQAFREHPPDDELVVSVPRRIDEKTAETTYAWASSPGRSVGRVRITVQRGRISVIRVETFA